MEGTGVRAPSTRAPGPPVGSMQRQESLTRGCGGSRALDPRSEHRVGGRGGGCRGPGDQGSGKRLSLQSQVGGMGPVS